MAGLRLEGVPEDVSPDRIEAGGLDLHQPVGPVFARDALVVDLAGHDAERLAVEEEFALAETEVAALPAEPRQDGEDDDPGHDPSGGFHAALPTGRSEKHPDFITQLTFRLPADIIPSGRGSASPTRSAAARPARENRHEESTASRRSVLALALGGRRDAPPAAAQDDKKAARLRHHPVGIRQDRHLLRFAPDDEHPRRAIICSSPRARSSIPTEPTSTPGIRSTSCPSRRASPGRSPGRTPSAPRPRPYIEAEFFGTSDADLNGFRLRHGYLKLDWPHSELMVGQFWHPMFVTESFPDVVSFNTGAPFQPFNRSPRSASPGRSAASAWPPRPWPSATS